MGTAFDLVAGVAGQTDGWHGGWIWWPLIPLLWFLLLAMLFWIGPRRWWRERTGVDRARDILAERFARGEITLDEYRERVDQLR
jgi:putative membrane protein